MIGVFYWQFFGLTKGKAFQSKHVGGTASPFLYKEQKKLVYNNRCSPLKSPLTASIGFKLKPG